MFQKLIQDINDADMILIGVGAEASSDFKFNITDLHCKNDWMDYKKYSDMNFKEKCISFYNKLENLVGNKNYFVVTTNFDGYIWESNLNPIRVVAPCGNINKLQCRCEDITEAPEDYYLNNKIFVCDKCKSEYLPNVFNKEYYNESGYLKQWNLYNKWLQGTLNKKLLVIEIGCDFSMLQIIRLPFEKIVMINQKALFYRVNEKYPQITAELKDKMISINKTPFDFIESCCSIL